MFIEVNIWLPSTTIFGKRITNTFGAFFSQFAHEHAGHVNCRLMALEDSPTFSKLEENSTGLAYQKSLRYVPERAPNEQVLGKAQDTLHFYRRKMTKADVVTFSFWPEKKPKLPSVFKDLLHLLHLTKPSKGTKSCNNNHEQDRKQEATTSDFASIKHGANLRKKESNVSFAHSEKSALIYEASNLEVALEKQATLKTKISELLSNKENLLSQQKELTQTRLKKLDEFSFQALSLAQKQDRLIRKQKIIQHLLIHLNVDNEKSDDYIKYQKQLDNLLPQIEEVDIQLAILDFGTVKLNDDYCKQSQDLESKLQQKCTELETAQRNLEVLKKEINGRTMVNVNYLHTLLKKKIDMEQRQNNYQIELTESQGKEPNVTILLPTKTSGLPYFVNEEIVMNAMIVEQAANYSFILNNCVASTKRCLIKGILPIKNQLIDKAGFTEQDFKIQNPENPKSMRDWTKKLEAGLNRLNLQQPDPEKLEEPYGPSLTM